MHSSQTSVALPEADDAVEQGVEDDPQVVLEVEAALPRSREGEEHVVDLALLRDQSDKDIAVHIAWAGARRTSMASLVEMVRQDTVHMRREDMEDTLVDGLADMPEGLAVVLAAKPLEPPHFVLHNHNSDTMPDHRQAAEPEAASGHQPGLAILAGAHGVNKLRHQRPVVEPNTRPTPVADCLVVDQEVREGTGELAEWAEEVDRSAERD